MTRSSALRTVLAVTVLGATVLTVGSATASPSSPASSASSASSWGHAGSGDHHLRQGCHTYSFGYRVTAPSTDWLAEITLVNPRGRAVANKTFTSEYDPASGRSSWQVCSTSTSVGVQSIRMKVTSYDDLQRATAQREPAATFRFTGRP